MALKRTIFAIALGLASLAIGPAVAQINTGRTLVFSTQGFDPVPGKLTPDEAKTALDLAEKAFAANSLISPTEVTIKAAKVWPRVHGDGYVVCAIFPPTVNGPRVQLVAAVSVSTGPFHDTRVQNLFDEAAYNMFGCNTPGATTL